MDNSLGHWTLADGVELPEDFFDNPPLGFVYKITRISDGKFYIGQKKILRKEKRPPLKGKVRKRTVIKQTDWKTYNSSSGELQAEIANNGEDKYKYEIIEFCDSKWLLSYEELRFQMMYNVLLREDSYNGIVNVRLRKFQSLIEKYAK